jgi:DNA mismatch endonuclease, patch repair protein
MLPTLEQAKGPARRAGSRNSSVSVPQTSRPFSKSEMMARIRSRDTKPERAVRSALHRLGSRFRLHVRALPGSPDIANRTRRYAIFIHGCFWHQHHRCRLARMPKRNLEYWVPKLRRNNERDRRDLARLRRMGYRVLVIWECETKDSVVIEDRLHNFLGD